MKADIAAQWVTALRSGEYRKGKHQLHISRTGEFCCLGVLCDLAVKAGVEIDVDEDDRGAVRYDECSGSLPESVERWAGIGSVSPAGRHPAVRVGQTRKALTALNDGWNRKRALPFGEIADLIEADADNL